MKKMRFCDLCVSLRTQPEGAEDRGREEGAEVIYQLMGQLIHRQVFTLKSIYLYLHQMFGM